MYRRATLLSYLRSFLREKRGAVTVDWVVLTAAIVVLGIAVLYSVSGGTASLTDKINDELATTSTEGD